MRTLVTRNTPFDKFLAGDNSALTANQRRGAKLFFTAATNGGAGCFSCHAGPMLNKQPNDPDVTGTGQFVEENFFNIGLSDHLVQALNRLARNDPNFIDNGRQEITALDSDAFKFRSTTMRQLKGSRFFFHNGAFTSVRDVVEYFNAGVPQNPVTGAASTLTPRFTNPRGPGFPRGLGLTEDQVKDITDFLENALFDPAFVTFDPNSTTDTMQPNARDLTYSVYRPDLAALGAVDITNTNASTVIDTHLLIIVKGLSSQFKLENASGTTSSGDAYIRVFLPEGVLKPGQSISQTLVFTKQPPGPPPAAGSVPVTLTFLSGQGNP